MQHDPATCDYEAPTGFVDWYRLNDHSDVTSLPKDAKDAAKLRSNVRTYPMDADVEVTSPKTGKTTKRDLRKLSSGRGPKGVSGMWTANSKTRSPSWSVPAGLACPVVSGGINRALEELSRKKTISADELLDAVSTKIPVKCWGCYAKGGNYGYPETVQAQLRRYKWFESASDDEVIDTLDKSLQVVGLETCGTRTPVDDPKKREYQKGQLQCTFEPGKPPRFVRLFDSGDFTDARAVRIWTEVARRNPSIRFWAPTSAYRRCGDERSDQAQDELLDALRYMNKLPNVVVRPSAFAVDTPAPEVRGLGPGAAVTDTEEAHRHKKHNEKLLVQGKASTLTADICDASGCSPHYICPGDCTICRKCWQKDVKIAYVAHGARPSRKELARLVRRAMLDFTPEGDISDEQKPKWENVAKLAKKIAVDSSRIGPNGESGTPHSAAKRKIDWSKVTF
jgi:hypothetical protein